jgi:hypothetical protein
MKNKVLMKAMIRSPLSTNIGITSAPAGLFKQLKQEINLKECQMESVAHQDSIAGTSPHSILQETAH